MSASDETPTPIGTTPNTLHPLRRDSSTQVPATDDGAGNGGGMTAEVKKEFVPGMYGQDDPRCPKVQVGRFVLSRQTDHSVWIEDTEGGDAAEFQDAELENVLAKFYNERF